jgi:hypothetical protein
MERKMKSNYLLIGLCSLLIANGVSARHFFVAEIGTASHYIRIQEALLNDEALQQGDEIAAFDPQSVCAGVGIVGEEGLPDLDLWPDDPETARDEGFRENDPLHFKVWSTRYFHEIETELTIIDGEERFLLNSESIIRLEANFEGGGGGAEGIHFRYDISDRNAAILVMGATIEGIIVAENDEVGVFDPGGLCAGAALFEINGDEAIAGVAAWGDDPQTPGDEGFRNGDPYVFRLWDASTQIDHRAFVRFIEGEQRYVENGFSILSLSADGIPHAITEDRVYSFGLLDLDSGETAEWETSIWNNGTAPLIIQSIGYAGDSLAFRISVEDSVVTPNDFSLITVTFPGEEFNYDWDYSLAFTFHFDEIRDTLQFSATGVVGSVGAEPDRAEIEFEDCFIYDVNGMGYKWNDVDSLLVRNAGRLPLVISEIIFPDSAFRLFPGSPDRFVAPPDSEVIIPLMFNPYRTGACSTVIALISNSDIPPSPLRILLTGTGADDWIGVRENYGENVTEYSVSQLYPNPFNETAELGFSLPRSGNVCLTIHDLSGRELVVIREDHFTAGQHKVEINAPMLPSGVYLLRFESVAGIHCQKALLLR